MGSLTAQHSGQVSILLGGDNNFYFPKEIERDSQGLALYQSKLTSNHLIYGRITENIISSTLLLTTLLSKALAPPPK